MAKTQAQAERAFDDWIERFEDKYPKATARLARDREQLLAFYDFPAAHWTHLRTTNVIESAFATIRHRSSRAKGLRHAPHDALDDLQDGHECGDVLAAATRLPSARQGDRGREIQRRHRGHRGQQGRRVTNPPYTRFDHSS